MFLIRFILTVAYSVVGVALLIPLIIVTVPFWLINGLLKLAEKCRPAAIDWKDRIEYDPVLGRRPKALIDAYMETDGLYRVTTGPDGWRGNYRLKDSSAIVIGDSFVFGSGANDGNHFANLTNSARVKPIGGPGYGVVHYLLLLKNLTTELKGKLVIWFVYTGNDFRESIRPSSYGFWFPFVFFNNEKGKWQIRTDHINPKKLPFNFEKGYKNSIPELADLFSKNYLSDYAYSAFEYLANEAKMHCDAHGAKFAVVPIPLNWILDGNYTYKIKRFSSNPEDFSVQYPEEQMGRICERLGITFQPTFDYFVRKDYLPRDLHWSVSGNEKAANIIDELYKRFLDKTGGTAIRSDTMIK